MFDLTHMFYTFFIPESFTPATHTIMWFADNLYFVGDILFYILLIKRVYDTFKDTTYALNKPLLIFLSIILTISSLSTLYYAVTLAFLVKSGSDWVYWDEPPNVILMVNDFILNLSLCILFIVKLRQVVIEFEMVHNWHLEDKDADLSSKGYRLLDVVTRHSIVFGLAIFTNQLYYAACIYISYSGMIAKNFAHGAAIGGSVRAMENVVNLFALWIALSMNFKIYIKLCKFPHIFVQRRFARRTTEMVIDRYVQLQGNDESQINL